MANRDLYDLLRQLSEGGRAVAAQERGLSEHQSVSETAPVLLPRHVNVAKAFAQAGYDQTAVWQNMPQAGISLTDVARYTSCHNALPCPACIFDKAYLLDCCTEC